MTGIFPFDGVEQPISIATESVPGSVLVDDPDDINSEMYPDEFVGVLFVGDLGNHAFPAVAVHAP